MKKTSVITFGVLILLLLGGAAVTYTIQKSPNDKPNSEATKTLATTDSQVFTDLQGNPLLLDQYEGKVRVVNSWASWSPFSAEELPALEDLASAYSEQNVVVIAINRKEPKEQAVRFLSSLKQFEHIVFAVDTFDTFYASVGGYSMPETIFYDADGNISFHKRGSMTQEEMRSRTEEAMGAK